MLYFSCNSANVYLVIIQYNTVWYLKIEVSAVPFNSATVHLVIIQYNAVWYLKIEVSAVLFNSATVYLVIIQYNTVWYLKGAISRLLHLKLLLSKSSSFHFYRKYTDKCDLILTKELFQQTELSRINTVGNHIALLNNLF